MVFQEEIRQKVETIVFYGKHVKSINSFKLLQNSRKDIYCWANKETGDVEVWEGSTVMFKCVNGKYPVCKKSKKWLDIINDQYAKIIGTSDEKRKIR